MLKIKPCQDIIALQDFRTETTNQLAKIRLEISALLDNAAAAATIVGQALPTNHTGRPEGGHMSNLMEEAKELKASLKSLKEGELLFREQIQQVFVDVDEIKASQRQISIEQEKANRNLDRLKNEDIVDISTR